MSPIRRRLFFEPALSLVAECVWRPAVDVRRARDGWIVKAELPGVAPEQVEVAVQGNSLVLSGVRKDTLLEEGQSYYAMEIAYCRFERRVDLPGRIENAQVTVASRDGLLIVRIRPSRQPDAPASPPVEPA